MEPPGIDTTYDISRDGARFLMLMPDQEQTPTAAQIVIVQNWFSELERLVPSKGR